MTAQPHRSTAPAPRDPVVHELPPLRLTSQQIAVQLSVRRDDDGDWRARLLFVEPGAPTRETADIFRATSEAELWQSVRGLPDHHLRALYLSLA